MPTADAAVTNSARKTGRKIVVRIVKKIVRKIDMKTGATMMRMGVRTMTDNHGRKTGARIDVKIDARIASSLARQSCRHCPNRPMMTIRDAAGGMTIHLRCP